MWLLALAVVGVLFGAMAAVFGRQERAERRRVLVEAAVALELDGRFDTAVLDRLDGENPGGRPEPRDDHAAVGAT